MNRECPPPEKNLVNLIDTARLLSEHSSVYGTAESYFTSIVDRPDGDPERAVLHLGSSGEHELPTFGATLAAEAQVDGGQRETVGCLVDGLDRDRLSARKLFPEELKGRSW